MKQSLKRFISRLLCLVMLLQVMPVNILAEGELLSEDSNEAGGTAISGLSSYSTRPVERLTSMAARTGSRACTSQTPTTGRTARKMQKGIIWLP